MIDWPDWKPIAAAPKKGGIQILAYSPHDDIGFAVIHWGMGTWLSSLGTEVEGPFTHWMPLPPNPRTK